MNNRFPFQRPFAFATTFAASAALVGVAATAYVHCAHADPAPQSAPTSGGRRGARIDPNYVPPPASYVQTAIPANPVVMDDIDNNTGNRTAFYDRTGNIAQPLAPGFGGAINPEQDNLFVDPGLRQKKTPEPPLPLFGYDFFSAPRQLITARRLYFEQGYRIPRYAAAGPSAPGAYPLGQQTPYGAQPGGAPYGASSPFNPAITQPYAPSTLQPYQPAAPYTGQQGYSSQAPQSPYVLPPAYTDQSAYPGQPAPASQPYTQSPGEVQQGYPPQNGYAPQWSNAPQNGQPAQTAYPQAYAGAGYPNQAYPGQYPPAPGQQLPAAGAPGYAPQSQQPLGTVDPDVQQSENVNSGRVSMPIDAPQVNPPIPPAEPSSPDAAYQPQQDQAIPSLDPYYYQIHPVQPAPAPRPPQQPAYGQYSPYAPNAQYAPYNPQTTPQAGLTPSSNYPFQPYVPAASNMPAGQNGAATSSATGAANPMQQAGALAGAGQIAPTTTPGYAPQTVYQPPAAPLSQAGLLGESAQPVLPEPGQAGQIDAYHEVADPLTQLFRNVQQSLPANYQLNPGDTITLRVWSPTIPMREFTRTIDNRGMIYLTDTGPQVVRGLTTAQAENQLRSKLQRMYRNMDVSITLSELRTMTVTVSGEAFAPGTYSVPAGTSAFNLLYAAGGPTLDGSMRDIEVRRNGGIAGKVDLYEFIMGDGDKADMTLQPGDIIYIPSRFGRVTVHGEVRHPAIFEVKTDETVSDVVRFAGGVKPSGVSQRIELNTFQPGQARLIKDIDLTDGSAQKETQVYDGDDVSVFSVRDVIMNRVTIDGAVDQPGDYALTAGMRVSDLIERARGPVEDAYTARADLYRWNADNTLTLVTVDIDKALTHDPQNDVALSRWDRLHIYTREQVQWTGRREVIVRGAVQRPGAYYRSDNMYVKDLLLQAGGTLPDAYLDRAVLLHQHPDGSFTYDYVDIAESLKTGGDPGPLIQNNDILAVYRVGEAQFTPDHTVTIRGRVNTPGVYPRGEKMRLTDLLRLAGGFIPGSGYTVKVTHPGSTTLTGPTAQHTVTVALDSRQNVPGEQDVLLQDGDVVTVQGVGGVYAAVRVVTVGGAVRHPGPIPMTSNMRVSDAIAAAGGFLPEAYPAGAEFVRRPEFMTTETQETIANTIRRLNDLINDAEYRREEAKSDVERLQAIATGGASTTSSGALGGVLGGQVSAPPAQLPAGAANVLQQRDLVSPPRLLDVRELVPNGDIAINLPAAMSRPGGREDLALMDGDTINVPEKPTTIEVIGAVFNSRGVLFKPGANIDYYLNQAGGLAPDAARDRIEIIHIGGGLITANSRYQLEPGDVILVPTKVLAESIAAHRNFWSESLGQITNAAVLIAVLTRIL